MDYILCLALPVINSVEVNEDNIETDLFIKSQNYLMRMFNLFTENPTGP